MTSLTTALVVWSVLALTATGVIAAVLAGARRIEARVLASSGMPDEAPCLVALGIALPAPRTAVEDAPVAVSA